jgi:hypothetical protein
MHAATSPVLRGADAHVMDVVECSIPVGTTIGEWRREREARCEHVHETTTRYDHEANVLEFFLFCPVCRTSRVVCTLDYEPRFEPITAAVQPLRPRAAGGVQRHAA